MKAVLISIQPKWVEKIASWQKTIEVRKTAPKCEVPFKCYIYCTNTPKYHHLYDLRYLNAPDDKIKLGCVQHNKYSLVAKNYINGKVIGEFVCDNVEWMSMRDCDKACMTLKEAVDYAKGKKLYAWHISDLKIYDKPKQVSDFVCKTRIENCVNYCKNGICTGIDHEELCRNIKQCAFKRFVPKSWCYVEEL